MERAAFLIGKDETTTDHFLMLGGIAIPSRPSTYTHSRANTELAASKRDLELPGSGTPGTHLAWTERWHYFLSLHLEVQEVDGAHR